ncbi:MAG: hypothetical protein KAT15_30605 [Bacteroidales bacterium]|nr:hypothetical protein [Bacteroidales bacterium]
MTTSRVLVFSILLAFFSLAAFGQRHLGREQNMEKFKSMKIAYYTDNLELTIEEAEIFWPLYNGFEKQKGELMKKRRMRSREFIQQYEEISEQEAEKMVDQHIELRKQVMQLDIDFHKELKKIFSPKKVMQFYITEIQFREYMLRQIRDDRAGSKQRQGRQLP